MDGGNTVQKGSIMHALHKILVNISNETNKMSREEKVKALRRLAEEDTEQFCGIAYDWRETKTAGRWAEKFPENVIFAYENPKMFRKFLEDVAHSKEEHMTYYIKKLREGGVVDITDLAKGKGNPYYLKRLAILLEDDYNDDLNFYNQYTCCGSITQEDIDDIMAEKENWAIVLFDCHN